MGAFELADWERDLPYDVSIAFTCDCSDILCWTHCGPQIPNVLHYSSRLVEPEIQRNVVGILGIQNWNER